MAHSATHTAAYRCVPIFPVSHRGRYCTSTPCHRRLSGRIHQLLIALPCVTLRKAPEGGTELLARRVVAYREEHLFPGQQGSPVALQQLCEPLIPRLLEKKRNQLRKVAVAPHPRGSVGRSPVDSIRPSAPSARGTERRACLAAPRSRDRAQVVVRLTDGLELDRGL